MAPRLATLCPHTDKPEKAKGRCASCYRSYTKAQKAAAAYETGEVRVDDNDNVDLRWQPSIPKGLNLEDDEIGRKYFEQIMWGWILEGEQVRERPTGMDIKDWVRLKEVTASKAMKAATVLGRKFIVEKKEILAPQAIPVAGAEEAVSGWTDVMRMGHGKNNYSGSAAEE